MEPIPKFFFIFQVSMIFQRLVTLIGVFWDTLLPLTQRNIYGRRHCPEPRRSVGDPALLARDNIDVPDEIIYYSQLKQCQEGNMCTLVLRVPSL